MLVSFDLNVDNGGSPILDYSLEINDGTTNGPYAVVASYNGINS
jgi:hypothetical protein